MLYHGETGRFIGPMVSTLDLKCSGLNRTFGHYTMLLGKTLSSDSATKYDCNFNLSVETYPG